MKKGLHEEFGCKTCKIIAKNASVICGVLVNNLNWQKHGLYIEKFALTVSSQIKNIRL